MQFSDTSTKLGIVEDITFLLGVDTNNYGLNDRTRNINERYRLVWQMIFESYGGWRFMDDNVSDASTGVPYADQTITSGTGLYSLPSGSLTIDAIEVKTTASGPLTKLIPLTFEEFLQMGGDASFPSNGVPTYFILQGDICRFLPVPNFTLSSAIRIYFDQGMSVFAASDTTKTPGFASLFHRMLSIGAALDYALARGITDKVSYLSSLWQDYEVRLRQFYSKRYKAKFPHQIGAGYDLVEEFR